MPAERFYLDADLQGSLTLMGTELHHLAHVCRIRPGEEIELVNGRGTLAKAVVLTIDKQKATLEILSSSQIELPPRSKILAIPLMRPSKLELIIEKCTELGADAFWIYPAEHSEKGGLSAHQLERLRYLAISALKQCGRLDLPDIQILSSFNEIFQPTYTYLFGDTRPSAATLICQEKTVVITGPEKGFSKKELYILDQKGHGVRLHKNILRAETAPIAAIILTFSNT
jgi:16S rRNA (uracil1498-N3)-methyltransferase